jgi:indole-3-glycerol phosphate synthase
VPFLSEIFEQKRALAAERNHRPCRPVSPLSKNRQPAFTWAGFSVVAEIKRASPSLGPIANHPLAPWAQGLEGAGAAMLSVLTEERFFSGSLETLAEVGRLTQLPLLRKDFLSHPFELDEAVAFGASAVLLIAAGFADPRDLKTLFEEARARALGVLLEVHEPEELDAAFECSDFSAHGVMLGINQRNLQTLAVDPRYAERFVARLPKGTQFIIESGISGIEDVRWAKNLGARGILVGEALARAPDPGARLAEWMAAC